MDKRAERLCVERVQRGITYLNKKVGEDWPTRIRIDELDLAAGSHCVLGQLIPLVFERLGLGIIGADGTLNGYWVGFYATCEALGLSERTTTSLGFTESEAERHPVRYADLQLQWEKEIGRLQREQELVLV